MYYDLNERQTIIYRFICDYIQKYGYSPTIREIGDNVGMRSTSTVYEYLRKLEEGGYIIRQAYCARAIKVV